MTASRSVKGLWQPKPSIYGMLMNQLASLLPTKPAEFPAVHYSFLHALFQDCHSNGHYIAGATSGRGVSSIGSLTEVLLLLTKQLQLYSLPFDIWCPHHEDHSEYGLKVRDRPQDAYMWQRNRSTLSGGS